MRKHNEREEYLLLNKLGMIHFHTINSYGMLCTTKQYFLSAFHRLMSNVWWVYCTFVKNSFYYDRPENFEITITSSWGYLPM